MTNPLPSTTAWAQFGDEIRLKILTEALTFPNGINGARWAWLKQFRVDKFLALPGAGHMAPEALYKKNIVIIIPHQPSRYTELCAIDYPKPEINHWVRRLEFRPWIYGLNVYISKDMTELTKFADSQVDWLHKLASGSIGFQELDLLRIVVESRRISWDGGESEIDMFVENMELSGCIRFRAKKLEIVVQGTCPGACRHEGKCTCKSLNRLKRLLSVHQDPLPETTVAEVSSTST
ncbi:hypothetical protein K505DRAFT_369265 [Melanomma pulvis-pyrius CBS 109.77]|uniref:Uncharacterized protein n=1 Tax=Melanomma pulvis-pyrius CBS 109.77 TaxID=1314802 RepID=A0A6A6WN07_9PLEO|nr:hypothetical protein K505DRAFT_369265 [Melanomma pulvis-pyrius CBS 109.77]